MIEQFIAEECFQRYSNASMMVSETTIQAMEDLKIKLLELGFTVDDIESDLDNAFSGLSLLRDKYHALGHLWRCKKRQKNGGNN